MAKQRRGFPRKLLEWVGWVEDSWSLTERIHKLSWIWQWILAHIWVWGAAMISATITGVWGIIEALPGSILFLNCLGAFAITLVIANQIQLRRIRKEQKQGKRPTRVPPQLPKVPPQPRNALPIEKDIRESYRQERQLQLFVEEKMQPAWRNMMRTMDQVNGQLNTKGGAYRYYVRALKYFMASLETSSTKLDSLLANKEAASSPNFRKAQDQLADLYKRYQERMPWVRDLAWYTNPNIRTSDHYKDWREADENMRKALKNLLPLCPVLSEQVQHLSSPDPWWWEKAPATQA